MLHLPSLLVLLLSIVIIGVKSHEESGPWSCESNSEIQLKAHFEPGLITLDGHGDDWKDIHGFDFSLLPALDPDADKEYKGGKMTVKVLFLFLMMVLFSLFFTVLSRHDNYCCVLCY